MKIGNLNIYIQKNKNWHDLFFEIIIKYKRR